MTTMILMFTLVTQNLNLPQGLLSAVCYVETHHKIKAIHKHDGHGDSLGICQIKQRTASELGFFGDADRLQDPVVNIYYSGLYLKKLILRYKSVDKAIVAYNIGHYDPYYKVYLKKVKKALKEGR